MVQDVAPLRILVTTDNHLGFEERDAIRGDDSFLAFAEVLSIARAEAVDLVLLGGDLFHDNKPSRECLYRCMKLLQEYNREAVSSRVVLETIEDGEHSAQANRTSASWHMQRRAAPPVFAIHGNHDDPVVSARLSLSPLDILQAAGLLYYWGSTTDNDTIRVLPLILRKGVSSVALYGLGHVREERLYATWQVEKRLVFVEPPSLESDSEQGEYVHVFVLHQNRERRGHTKAVTRDLLPPWLDLVIWGHEHPCHIELDGMQPAITQPGSTVATALTQGEALEKHVGLLEIQGTSWRWKPLPLRSVRPFHYEELHLARSTHEVYRDPVVLERYLREHVEGHLRKLDEEFTRRQHVYGADLVPDQLRQPLMRLRIEYDEGFTPLGPVRFGRNFLGRVANPSDMVAFHRRPRAPSHKADATGRTSGGDPSAGICAIAGGHGPNATTLRSEETAENDPWASISVLDLANFLLSHTEQQMSILPDWKIAEAVDHFVNKGEIRAVSDHVEIWIARLIDHLEKRHRNAPITDQEELLQETRRFAQQQANRAGVRVSDAGAGVSSSAGPSTNDELTANTRTAASTCSWMHRRSSYLSPNKLRLLEALLREPNEHPTDTEPGVRSTNASVPSTAGFEMLDDDRQWSETHSHGGIMTRSCTTSPSTSTSLGDSSDPEVLNERSQGRARQRTSANSGNVQRNASARANRSARQRTRTPRTKRTRHSHAAAR